MDRRIKILVTVLIVPVVLINQLGFIDHASRDFTEAGLKRALVTYAVARGLNGIISVAQGTEVAIEPVGIGLTFTPGQILDPVNDLVERFSWVVLVSGTSLGIQELLLHFSAWFWFKLIVSVSALAVVMLLWLSRAGVNRFNSISIRLALILLAVRFCVPAITCSNEIIYRNFLEPRYQASSEELRKTSLTLDAMNRDTRDQIDAAEGEGGLLDSARRLYRSAAGRVNIDARIEALKQAAENLSEHTINLIVIFITQTLLLPLLFLWLFLQFVKWIINADFRLQ